MNEINVDDKELTNKLLIKWLDKLAYLSDIKRRSIYNMASNYYNNTSFLLKINTAIVNEEKYCSDNDVVSSVIYEKENDKHILSYNDEKMEFTYIQIKEIISGMIDLLEKIHPLGTVVQLKNQFLKNIIADNKIENARFVIINRFMFHNEIKTYFQYAGVVYPLGMVGDGKAIQFTTELIEKVIHEGYSDEQEEAYVYLLKKELVIEKKMHSFGFSTKDEREDFEMKTEVESK